MYRRAGSATDGAHVVSNDDFGQGEQIYTSALNGTGLRCLTCGQAGPNMVPEVQPHGAEILFHSWKGHRITFGAPGFGGIGSNLFVVRADGSHIVQLTNDTEGTDNFHAYWSPDGTRRSGGRRMGAASSSPRAPETR